MTQTPAEPAPNDPAPVETPSEFKPPASQADLDRIISDRLARERAKFSDYDAIKAKAAEHDKALEAARTDQDKAVEAARLEGRTEALSTANTRLVSAEARAIAAEAKFRNPLLAIKAVDLAGVTVGDDGTVDTDAIKAKLKELADAEPYLIDDGKRPAPKPDPSQGNTGGSTATPSVARGRELYAARRGTPTS